MSRWFIFTGAHKSPQFRLFCFHHAGGSAQLFRTWHEFLPSNVQVVAIELPGHGTRFREPLLDRWRPIVSNVTRELTPLLDVPYAMFGHSMGALLAFETARSIHRAGLRRPKALFASGRGAPCAPRRLPAIHQLDEPSFLAKLRRYNGCPPEVLASRELLDIFVPILRADFAVGETYSFDAGDLLEHPFWVLVGDRDDMVHEADIKRWGELTWSSTKHHTFNGDHFYLRAHERRLVNLIGSELLAHELRPGWLNAP